MVDYQASVSDISASRPLRLLVVGEGFDLRDVGAHTLSRASEKPAEDLKRYFPDLLLLNAGHIDQPILDTLASKSFTGLPVIVATNDHLADQAGLLLDNANVRFIEDDASPLKLAAAVNDIQAVAHAADAGEVFNPQARIETLKRDAERVVAALAELVLESPPAQESERPVDAARIRAHIRARRAREKFFPAEIMADPAWDMLLDLAAARLEERPVAVSSLCIAASVPTTTGLRWIKSMIERGYFIRTPDPDDGRRAFISMTEPTIGLMESCLRTTLNYPGQ